MVTSTSACARITYGDRLSSERKRKINSPRVNRENYVLCLNLYKKKRVPRCKHTLVFYATFCGSLAIAFSAGSLVSQSSRDNESIDVSLLQVIVPGMSDTRDTNQRSTELQFNTLMRYRRSTITDDALVF